jgi:hypothetical protein
MLKFLSMTEKFDYSEKAFSNEKLKRIKESVTLKNLMEADNYKGPNLLPYVKDLLRLWHSNILPTVRNEAAKTKIKEEKKPYDVRQDIDIVSLDKTRVHILGVSHHDKILETPYGRSIQDFIKSTAKNGYSWFAEENLDKNFWIFEETLSLNDVSQYIDHTGGKTNNWLVAFFRAVRESYLATKAVTTVENKELRKEIKNRLRLDSSGVSCIGILKTTSLPEPLNMEASLVLAHGEKIREKVMSTDRSLLMAEELKQEISLLQETRKKDDNRIINVGIVCGYAHKSEIAYLLTHPDYNPHESLKSARDMLAGKR